MSIAARLRRLDDRVFPDSGRHRYDSSRPWSVRFAGIVVVPLLFGAFDACLAGGWWLLLAVALGFAVILLFFSVLRWTRQHTIERR
jgi:hypothetical protein